MKKIILVLCLMPFICLAQYHRFYRGYTHADLDLKNYVKNMNKDFFPLFAKAVPEGLVSYKPVLLNEDKSFNLPQEIALLTFKNEEIYKAYGNSEIGKKIRAAHGPVFDSNKSKSVVPEVFLNKITFESAYIMNPEFKDFSKGVAGVLIMTDSTESPESILKKINKIFLTSGKQNLISLISENYVIEYLFAPNESELEKLRSNRYSQLKEIFKTSKFVILEKHKISEKTVNFGQGMDAQW